MENQSKRYNSNMFGKTENMQSTHLKGNKSTDQIVAVKIIATRGNSLIGELWK
jgi:tRNA A37 methylthiotransferase MiaB